jgi:hypothetical protein
MFHSLTIRSQGSQRSNVKPNTITFIRVFSLSDAHTASLCVNTKGGDADNRSPPPPENSGENMKCNFGYNFFVRFQVLTATNMKMAVFRDVVLCSLVVIISALMTEAVSTSETSVNINTAQHPRRQPSLYCWQNLFKKS